MRRTFHWCINNPGWTLVLGILLYYIASIITLDIFGLLPF